MHLKGLFVLLLFKQSNLQNDGRMNVLIIEGKGIDGNYKIG